MKNDLVKLRAIVLCATKKPLRDLMRRMVQIALPALLACLPLAFACLAQTAPPRPNVLLIITDDQGYSDLGLHGNEQVRTPNMDLKSVTLERLASSRDRAAALIR